MSTLETHMTVRCTYAEREAWHTYANARGVKLSHLTRTTLNNLSGVYDPPHLEMFKEEELAHWQAQTTDGLERKRRGRVPGGRATLLLVLVVGLFLAGLDEALAVVRSL